MPCNMDWWTSTNSADFSFAKKRGQKEDAIFFLPALFSFAIPNDAQKKTLPVRVTWRFTPRPLLVLDCACAILH